MASRHKVATRQSSEAQRPERQAETALRPRVDIFEDAEGITLLADMPGVSRDRLNVQVERDSLIIEGTAQLELPEGMEALYADVRCTRYQRNFTLGNELATDRIDASLKDGVLRVRIPKREEVRPRKIEVQVS